MIGSSVSTMKNVDMNPAMVNFISVSLGGIPSSSSPGRVRGFLMETVMHLPGVL